MKRRLRNFLPALSLLLCVAVVALWARSFDSADVLEIPHRSNRSAGVVSARGGVKLYVISRVWVHRTDRPAERWLVRTGMPARAAADWGQGALGMLGFRRGVSFHWLFSPFGEERSTSHWVVLPYWLLLLAAAVPVLSRMYVRRRAARRSRLSLCPRCGYDLRATPGRCPECGWSGTVSTTP
jgi:hypothetical protein